jgi:hypothetical protein
MLRQALVLLVVVVIFGILVPWYRGFSFLQPWIIVAYGAMALLFVAPASAEFWGVNPPPDSARAVLGRILVVVGYGWGVTVLMLVSAIVTLNLAYWRGQVLYPPGELMASVLTFSLTASIAVAALCAVLALRFSAGAVKGMLRIFFLLVLLVLAFGSRFLPESWQLVVSDHSTRRGITRMAWEASVVCAAAGAGLLAVLVRGRSTSKPVGAS